MILKNKTIITIFFIFSLFNLNADKLIPITALDLKSNVKINIKPYGFVKLDTWYDTNQVILTHQDHSIIGPMPIEPSVNGQNINSRGQVVMTSIESRMGVLLNSDNIIGSDLKTFGRIEADFIGTTEYTISSFRLRHAYGIILQPYDYEILFGQYYDPLFIPECCPHNLAFDKGVAFEPQARNPQLRVTKIFGNLSQNLEVTLAALAQGYFCSPGPIGFFPVYQRNSLTPMFTLRLINNFNPNFWGAAIAFKRIVPRLVTDKNYKTDAGLNSIIAEAFLKLIYNNLFFNSKVVYSQNGPDQLLLGGYGVETLEPTTDLRTYKSISSVSAWLDTYIVHNCLSIGLFIGGTKKLKNKDKFYIDPTTNEPILYDLQPEITKADSIFKIAPRMFWVLDPLRIGIEINYSRINYGNKFNQCANIFDFAPAHNIRFLGVAYYLF